MAVSLAILMKCMKNLYLTVIKHVFCVLDVTGYVVERKVLSYYGGRIHNTVFGCTYYLKSTLCYSLLGFALLHLCVCNFRFSFTVRYGVY